MQLHLIIFLLRRRRLTSPGDFKEFADADINNTYPSQIFELCVNGATQLGYAQALAEEWCTDDAGMISVKVEMEFDRISVIINLPNAGTDFVPPLSEIASITVEYTQIVNDTDYFGPAMRSSSRRAGVEYTDVEVVVSASTTPPSGPATSKGGPLKTGAIVGIAVGGIALLLIVYMVGKGGSGGSASERKGLLGNVYKDGVKG